MNCIYKITNIKSGSMYIGKTSQIVEKRFKQHIYEANRGISKTKLYDAIRSYGAENFKVDIIANNINDDDVNKEEKYFIKKYNTLVDGYNLTCGGDGGATRTGHITPQSVKDKISAAQKGKPKINPGMCGKYPKSEEHKQKLSQAVSKTAWVTNFEKTIIKKILTSELPIYISNGWIRGRKTKQYLEKLSDSTKKGDFLTPDERESLRLKNKENIWICHPNKKSIMINYKLFVEYQLDGWSRGRKFNPT